MLRKLLKLLTLLTMLTLPTLLTLFSLLQLPVRGGVKKTFVSRMFAGFFQDVFRMFDGSYWPGGI